MSWTQRMREQVNMETDLAGIIPGRTRQELRKLADYLNRRQARTEPTDGAEEPAREGDPTDLYDYLHELGGSD